MTAHAHMRAHTRTHALKTKRSNNNYDATHAKKSRTHMEKCTRLGRGRTHARAGAATSVVVVVASTATAISYVVAVECDTGTFFSVFTTEILLNSVASVANVISGGAMCKSDHRRFSHTRARAAGECCI